MNNFKVLMNGIVKENPTFVLPIGLPLRDIAPQG